MLEGGRAVVRVDHVTRLSVHSRDPHGKVWGVGDGGGEEDLPHQQMIPSQILYEMTVSDSV